MYTIVYTKGAKVDISKLRVVGLAVKAKALVELIKKDPFHVPPRFEKLVGDLDGLYSRRINIKHRLVYEVIEDVKTVKIISMWSHYEF